MNACSRPYRDLPVTMHHGATARIRAVPEDLSFGLWVPCVVLEVLERPFHRYASKPALEHSQGVCMLAEGDLPARPSGAPPSRGLGWPRGWRPGDRRLVEPERWILIVLHEAWDSLALAPWPTCNFEHAADRTPKPRTNTSRRPHAGRTWRRHAGRRAGHRAGPPYAAGRGRRRARTTAAISAASR